MLGTSPDELNIGESNAASSIKYTSDSKTKEEIRVGQQELEVSDYGDPRDSRSAQNQAVRRVSDMNDEPFDALDQIDPQEEDVEYVG